MPRPAGFFVPLRIEGWGAKPALDLHAWEHVAEFSLDVRSGSLAFASGNCGAVKAGIAPGGYRARWSGRGLQEGDGSFRLQLWPGPSNAPRSELKRVSENGN